MKVSLPCGNRGYSSKTNYSLRKSAKMSKKSKYWKISESFSLANIVGTKAVCGTFNKQNKNLIDNGKISKSLTFFNVTSLLSIDVAGRVTQ